MKITFVSNFHNHHQIPLCDEFNLNKEVEFVFIATEKVPEERIRLGYQSEFRQYSYYREVGVDFTQTDAEQLCYESDVVIIGSASKNYVKRRLRHNKLTFLYSERFFKDGFWNHPGDIYRAFMMTTVYRFKPLYVLCASSYTAMDCRRILFGGKTLKWGYFPKTVIYDEGEIAISKKHDVLQLLWVGRMVEWKHPEVFLHICKRMKDCGIHFLADMIGTGELETKISQYIDENNLNENIFLKGSMPPDEVRKYMEKADVFLFTSDYREGWGAVLNEAMNSGCLIVACEEAGASDFLIEHEKNGFLYQDSSDEKQVFEFVKQIANNLESYDSVGMNAYHTIRDMWNAKTAAKRLYEFSHAFLNDRSLPEYGEGPMSQTSWKKGGLII